MPNAYGRLPHTDDPRDYRARVARPYKGAFVTLEHGFPAPWDQGQLGSCVSFGTCAAAVFARVLAGGVSFDPSELFLYFAARERAGYPVTEDTGLEIRDGFASLAHDGVPPAEDWPYDPAKFAERPPQRAYVDAAQSEALVYGAVGTDDIDATIAGGYPVVIGWDVFESFEGGSVADTGVMPVPSSREQVLGGHCTVLVSTPVDGSQIPGGITGILYRRGRNSWGIGWGDRGWYWHPVPAMNHASDFWQVTTISAPVPPVPPPGPTPVPVPGNIPSPQAIELAKVLRGNHDWVGRRHYGYTSEVAQVALAWLESEGL
jgi:C1A family cysteine protease